MNIQKLPISGPLLITVDCHRDERGFFSERYNRQKLNELGFEHEFVQDNLSRSKPRVLRGLHYQAGQGKLIGVVRGKIWDVAVDLRAGSPTFGKSFGLELNGDDDQLLWIPQGFAHGFCVLGNEDADVLYKVDAFYNPKTEGGIVWNDPDLNVDWPLKNPFVSSRDQSLSKFSEYQKNPAFRGIS